MSSPEIALQQGATGWQKKVKAEKEIARTITIDNLKRLHASLYYLTPGQVHQGIEELKKCWKPIEVVSLRRTRFLQKSYN